MEALLSKGKKGRSSVGCVRVRKERMQEEIDSLKGVLLIRVKKERGSAVLRLELRTPFSAYVAVCIVFLARKVLEISRLLEVRRV